MFFGVAAILLVLGAILVASLIIVFLTTTVPGTGTPVIYNTSTCNAPSGIRGPHQNVVSFCYYGDINNKRHYFRGVEDNALLVSALYPNWTMRVYHEQQGSNLDELALLQRRFPHLDLCNVGDKAIGEGRRLWRFYPMGDPLVDVFLSRDLDSRLLDRERSAVDEWLTSDLTAHVMRDHMYHNCAMLAGMWGVKVFQRRALFTELWEIMVTEWIHNIYKDLDQAYLDWIVWPRLGGDMLQHDCYYCTEPQYVEHGNMRPWPTRRNMSDPVNFVGHCESCQPVNVLCPMECRPKAHPDWSMC